MFTPTARAVEIGSLVLIALGLLARWPEPAGRDRPLSRAGLDRLWPWSPWLQVLAVRRNYLAGGELARLRVSRDVAFLAAVAASIAFVLSPARWSLGAAVAGALFGIAIELLARFSPKAA